MIKSFRCKKRIAENIKELLFFTLDMVHTLFHKKESLYEFRIFMESVYNVEKVQHKEFVCALVHQFSDSDPHNQMTFV